MLDIVAQAISSIGNVGTGQTLLFSLTIIIVIAAIFAFISKALKQELIPAYIISGIVIGPLVLGWIKDISIIRSLAEIGIAFLLFTAGLEISTSKIKDRAFPSIFTSIFGMIVIGIITFLIATALHFRSIEAIYLALILGFSSTVLVVKILSDRKELNTLNARIAIGVLLVQDIVAIIALILLNKTFTVSGVSVAILQAILLVLIAILLNKTVLKPLFKFASSSYELLFLAALAFVFFFAALAYALNLSIVIGAFVAGLALSNLPYKLEIESKIKPLRDFFTIIFFVSLGMWLTAFSLKEIWLPFVIFLAIIILVKPLVTAFALRICKYKSRTSIGVGFSIGQLSEFSLVLAILAITTNTVSHTTFNLIILLAIVTMALTPYMMKIDHFLFRKYHSLFKVFKNIPEKKEFQESKLEKKTILLFGCHRMGSILMKGLEKYKDKVIVVDFDPDVIHGLQKQGISAVYGDVISNEILETLPIQNLKIAISTIPKLEDNIFLIKHIKSKNRNIFITVSAEKIHDAIKLYEHGADYVIVPSIISGENALRNIVGMSKKQFKDYKKEQIDYLKKLHRYLY